MDKLNFETDFIKDESIEEYEYRKYTSEPGSSNFDNNQTVRFKINNQNTFLDISESYLEIKGILHRVKKSKNKDEESTFTDKDQVSLVNNGIMFLYDSIIYKLDNNIIEQINNPGETSTIIGYLTYSDSFERTKGLNQMWFRDGNISFGKDGFKIRHDFLINEPGENGMFSLVIPLKHIFGFCKTYKKVLFGFEHSLELTRKSKDEDAIIAHNTTNNQRTMTSDAHIQINDLSWYIPHVKPNLEIETKLLNQIKNKNEYQVLYKRFTNFKRTLPAGKVWDWRLTTSTDLEKPRFIIIAFQLEPQNYDKEFLDSAKFYHANLKNISVSLNSRKYPYEQYDMDFKNNDFARMFNEAISFKKKCFQDDSSVNITPFNYRRNHPIFVIDISNQNENIKGGLVDITVHFTFNEFETKNVYATAVIVSDRIIDLKADGSKFRFLL